MQTFHQFRELARKARETCDLQGRALIREIGHGGRALEAADARCNRALCVKVKSTRDQLHSILGFRTRRPHGCDSFATGTFYDRIAQDREILKVQHWAEDTIDGTAPVAG